MEKQDIRWQQRFSNYKKALQKLSEAVEFVKHNVDMHGNLNPVLDEIIKEGLIQRFEYTHELGWNVMKDYIVYQGNTNISGSRDATREAFQMNLIQNGEIWMDMIGSRNKTSHTYDESTADEIYLKILNDYYPEFVAFEKTMEEKQRAAKTGLF